jgi:hypothetical protein
VNAIFNHDYVNRLRLAELDSPLLRIGCGTRVFDLGARGAGRHAHEMQWRGFDVKAIDLPSSRYTREESSVAVHNVPTIPFEISSFEVSFRPKSSSTFMMLVSFAARWGRVLAQTGEFFHILAACLASPGHRSRHPR